MLYVTKFLLDGKLFDIKQSVDSRHDQPFFMSHQSDTATLKPESPDHSGDSKTRVAGSLR